MTPWDATKAGSMTESVQIAITTPRGVSSVVKTTTGVNTMPRGGIRDGLTRTADSTTRRDDISAESRNEQRGIATEVCHHPVMQTIEHGMAKYIDDTGITGWYF